MPRVLSVVSWQCPLQASQWAAYWFRVLWEPSLCQTVDALPAYSDIFWYFKILFSSLVSQVYCRRISDLSICLCFSLLSSLFSLLISKHSHFYLRFSEMKSSCLENSFRMEVRGPLIMLNGGQLSVNLKKDCIHMSSQFLITA